MKRTGAIAAGCALLAAAPAGAMTVADFIGKADGLKAKGMMALFSPDIKVLKAEIMSGAEAWRAQIPTARPPVCRPQGGVKMTDKSIMAIMYAVPPAERPRTQVKDALTRSLNDQYRCK